MTKPTVFISYCSKDRSAAETIHGSLAASGFEVWRDETRLERDWSREIAFALAGCDALCLLWTKNAAASRWVKHEWLTARALEKPIVLCLFPDAPDLPRPIENLHGLIFSSLAQGCRTLGKRVADALLRPARYDYTLLPENSFIPFTPNPHFTGRYRDLADLYLKMIGNLNGVGINQVGTIGMGGVGKTQLAVEFAHRFGFGFHAVHWIEAADADAWLGAFVALARDRLRGKIKDIAKLKGERQHLFALQEYFKKHPDTLVVMDNIADPRDLNDASRLFGFTPLTLGCNLLFTTRRHVALPGVVSKAVDVLSPEASYALLTSYRKPDPGEEACVEAICRGVGFLPLAITLSGAYLRRYRDDVGFEDYCAELDRRKLETIDIGELTEADLATRHVAAVKTTLADHWKMLQDADARNLFRLAGQFPEAAILPKGRLGLLAGVAPDRSRIDRPLARVFGILHDLCLAERLEEHSSAVRFHPLVREFSRQLLPAGDRQRFRAAAAGKLRDALFVFSALDLTIRERGVEAIIEDIEIGIDWMGADDPATSAMALLLDALRLSAHVLRQNPGQLTGHLLARLSDLASPDIRELLEQAAASQQAPWLRPMRASMNPPGGPLLRTLMHENQVTTLVLMHDGEHVVTGESDGTLTRWNWKRGTPVAKWSGHSSSVRALGISPDRRLLVAVFDDAWLKAFSLRNGSEHFSFRLAGMARDQVCVAGDAMTVAFIAGHGSKRDIVVLALDGNHETFREILRLTEPDVHALALNASGTILFWVVDTMGGSTLKTIDIAGGSAKAYDLGLMEMGRPTLAVSPDGRCVVVSSIEDPFAVWSFDPVALCRRFETAVGHRLLAVAADGRRGVSTDKGGALSLWDLEKLSEMGRLPGHTNLVHAVAITADGRQALSAGGDNTVNVWNLEAAAGHSPVHELHPARAITALTLSADGRRVAAGCWNGEVVVWNIRMTQPITEPLSVSYGPIREVSFLPDSESLFVITEGSAVQCDPGNMTCGAEIYLGGGWPLAVAPGGRSVLLSTADGIAIFDTGEQRTVLELETDFQSNGPALITPTGLAVIWSDDSSLRIFDLPSGVFLPQIEVVEGRVSALTMTPDGKDAILGFADGCVQLCNLDTRTFTSLANVHTDAVSSLAVAPGGRRIVSCSSDGSLLVWDLTQRTAIARFWGDGPLQSCVVTADDGTIIAGERSGRLHFLKMEVEALPVS